MKRKLPAAVLDAPAHSLRLVCIDAAVEVYIREDEFILASYPQPCSVELALPVWDDGRVLCVALLIQLGGRNAFTFDRWLNLANPDELRILQLLSDQPTIDIFLVSDRIARLMRERNHLSGKAAGIIATLRMRASWSDEDFQAQRRRLDILYPSSEALWRGARQLGK
jgi:hypothetical protein